MIELKESKMRFEEQKRKRANSISQIVPKTPLIEYILRKVRKGIWENMNETYRIIVLLLVLESEKENSTEDSPRTLGTFPAGSERHVFATI